MATGLRVEQKHSVWKLLPVHPSPQPLESMTSYMMRLAEANGLQSMNELRALAGAMILQRRPDYPASSYSGLTQITGHPQGQWLSMTFFYLVQHFGRSMHPHSLHKFLEGSISSTLRYCPRCLAEHTPAHYSLLWRFLVLPGCLEHSVHFLDRCSHCHSTLPLLSRAPQLTTCPTCQADLRSGIPAPLESSLQDVTEQYTNDLTMLLTPPARLISQEQAKLVGKRFQLLRLQQGLLMTEAASLMGRETSIVLHIDRPRTLSHSGVKQPCLHDYVRYAQILGYRLSEIFDQTLMLDLCIGESEEQLLDQVGQAKHQLLLRGKPLLLGSIADLMAMSRSRLRQYPHVKKLLGKWEQERKRERFGCAAKREDDLLKQLGPILQQLEASGSPLVLERVCHLVGLTYRWTIRMYPRVKALLHEYRDRLSQGPAGSVNEETKVQEVQAAINVLLSRGEPVTITRLRPIVNLTYYQLRRSPRAKALLAQYTQKRQTPAS